MQEFLISDVCRLTGLSRATILYYESKKLIHPKQDSNSSYRHYTMQDVATIMFYQNLKNIDISIAEYNSVAGSGRDGDVYALVLEKKNVFAKRMFAYMAMWDETLAMTYNLRLNGRVIRMGMSKGAWSVSFTSDIRKSKKVFDEWDKFFLQRNISYFFDYQYFRQGRIKYETGLSCYDDSTLPIGSELMGKLEYHPSRPSVMMLIPFNVESENFKPVMDLAFDYMDSNNLSVSAAPWAHLGYRDETNGKATDYLALWIPVESADRI